MMLKCFPVLQVIDLDIPIVIGQLPQLVIKKPVSEACQISAGHKLLALDVIADSGYFSHFHIGFET